MRASITKFSLVFATLLTLSACDDASQQGGGGAGMQMPPAEVNVITLSPEDVALKPEYPGRTQGSREVEVRARVGGILIERAYEEGQFVKKGQVLFRIDPAPYQVALDRARAQYAQAQAQLKAADREWQRVDPLFKEQAVSARTRDEALSAYETAKAGVGSAAAEVRAAKLNLDYTKVEAPISGITSKETVSEGSLIGTGQADSLLTHMTQLDPIYVNFAYPDSDFMAKRRLMEESGVKSDTTPALEANLTYSSGQAYPEKGTVSFTDATVNEQTGSVQARAVFPNPDGVLIPGQFVRLSLNGLVYPQAISVPQAAVMQGPQGKFVYKLSADSKAEIAPIKTGVEHGDAWIVDEGLKAGDVVIVDNLMKVQPNGPVSVKKPGGDKPADQAPADAAAPPQQPGSETGSAGGDAAAEAQAPAEATSAAPAAEQPPADDPDAAPITQETPTDQMPAPDTIKVNRADDQPAAQTAPETDAPASDKPLTLEETERSE